MIVCAAVKVFIYPLNKEVIIKCHRHCDAYEILHDFNYTRKDYETIEQGFLDENDIFYNRIDAYKHAWWHMQLKEEYKVRELYTEDLY